MQLRPDHLLMVAQCVRAALGKARAPEVTIVGSYARGDQVASSDLDVVIRCADGLSLRERARLRAALDASRLPFWVDIVDYHAIAAARRAAMLAGGRAVSV